jgi:hypothetical protein
MDVILLVQPQVGVGHDVQRHDHPASFFRRVEGHLLSSWSPDSFHSFESHHILVVLYITQDQKPGLILLLWEPVYIKNSKIINFAPTIETNKKKKMLSMNKCWTDKDYYSLWCKCLLVPAQPVEASHVDDQGAFHVGVNGDPTGLYL